MEYFAGVETHRDTHSIVILDELGKVVESFAIEATSQGYAQAIDRMRTVAPLQWGLEGTGSYGRGFADALLRAGYTVYEVPGVHQASPSPPAPSRQIRPAGRPCHRRGGATRAETLPRHLEEDQQQALRLLYDRRDRLVTEHTAKVNRVRALALRLEVPASSNLGTHRALERLRSALDQRPSLGYADFEVADELRSLIDDLTRIQNALAELEKRMRPFVERLAPALSDCAAVRSLLPRGSSATRGLSRTIAAPMRLRRTRALLRCHVQAEIPIGASQQRRESSTQSLLAHNRQYSDPSPRPPWEDLLRAQADRRENHRAAMRCLKRKLANVIFNVRKRPPMASQKRPYIPWLPGIA